VADKEFDENELDDAILEHDCFAHAKSGTPAFLFSWKV